MPCPECLLLNSALLAGGLEQAGWEWAGPGLEVASCERRRRDILVTSLSPPCQAACACSLRPIPPGFALWLRSPLLCLFSIRYDQARPSRNRCPVCSLLGLSRLPLRLQAIPAPSPTSIISPVPERPCCSSNLVVVSPVECPSSQFLGQRGLPLALPSSAYLEALTPAPSFCWSDIYIPKQCCFTIGQQPSPA